MKRSKHNLSHFRLLTGDMGQLLPVGLVEVLPGDSFQHGTSMLVRASPLATPPMHPVNIKVHHWYIPHRLVWSDFENFITGGPDGMDNSTFPTIAMPNPVVEGSLADYLGVPAGAYGAGAVGVSALPFRAYAMVVNEWYRDQDLQAALAISKASGVDITTSTALFNVAWEKDRFTTARPWEQKGPTVTLPIGGSAPVTGAATVTEVFGPASAGRGSLNLNLASTAQAGALFAGSPGAGTGSEFGELRGVISGTADLSSATAASVNAVRQAFALQRFAEARARYGSRFTEYLRFLGVRSSDARLQRPEYLGGGRNPLQFSEVLQTAQTAADADGVGQLYGHGIGSVRSNRYRRFFEEHGYVLSCAYVLPKTMYPDGLHATWNRREKEDFWQRELEHIGQVAIKAKEVYARGATPEVTFGFQDRYDDYRHMESSVHGEFRTLLNDWHFARLFAGQPTLNSSFITSDPAKRPFQAQSNDVLLFLAHHQLVARRIISRTGSSFIL